MASDPDFASYECVVFDRGPLVNAWHIIGEKIITMYDQSKYNQDTDYAQRQTYSPLETVPDITFQHPMHPESHKRVVGVIATLGMFGLFSFGVVKMLQIDIFHHAPTPSIDKLIHEQYNQDYYGG